MRKDFCCSVSGLALCSHSLEPPNTHRIDTQLSVDDSYVSLSGLASRHRWLSHVNENLVAQTVDNREALLTCSESMNRVDFLVSLVVLAHCNDECILDKIDSVG